MIEVLPGIHTWSVFSEEKKIDFNGHFILDEGGSVIIDPPPLTEQDAAWVDRAGPPEAIIITNCHHTRGARSLASRWRIPILLPEPDAQGIPDDVRVGGVYRDGDRLAAGLEAVSLTGQKSPGESALLCRWAGAVILGDALIGKPAGDLSLLPAEKYADPAAARQGLRRLLDFPFDAVLVGDGASIPSGGRLAVERFFSRR